MNTTTCTLQDASTTLCVSDNLVGFQEWLFVNAVLIFFIALMAWPRLKLFGKDIT